MPSYETCHLAIMVNLMLLVAMITFFGTLVLGKEAYVTLLYGEDFFLGVRVLGQSLRETGTTRDQIVLLTEDVSREAEQILKQDGWRIQRVQSLKNPFKNFQPRLEKVITKLQIWTLIEYDKLVFLDGDTLVLQNIDELFLCGNFCASMRHSERFNKGVMVLKPSVEIYRDMVQNLEGLGSYTGGDQGVLNMYFHELKFATLFDPKKPNGQNENLRLPSGYNGDIGVFYSNSQWFYTTEELKVVHFTLGEMKPWDWWTSSLFVVNWEWHYVRLRLPNVAEEFLVYWILHLLPLILEYPSILVTYPRYFHSTLPILY